MCSVHGNTTNGNCFQNDTVDGFPRCINLLKAYEGLMVLLMMFYIVVMVLAILGNTLIIYIVYSNRAMRTSTNIFIVNMAVCDLGMPFLVLPMRITRLYIGQRWLIPGDAGLALCKLLPFVQDAFVDGSSFALCLITYDRFCAVVFPHKYHLLSKKAVIMLISCAWLASISIRAIFLKNFTVFHVDGKTFCDIFWLSAFSYIAYFIVASCFVVFIPIFLVTTAYSAIFHKLKKQGLTVGTSLSDQQRHQQQLRQRKIIKMTFAIVCAFAVCWLPFVIMIFSRIATLFFSRGSSNNSPCWFIRGYSVSYYFLALISVTNPAICFIFGTAFREELKKLSRRVFGCCFRRRNEVVDATISLESRL